MKRPVVVGLWVNVMTRTLCRISGPLLPSCSPLRHSFKS